MLQATKAENLQQDQIIKILGFQWKVLANDEITVTTPAPGQEPGVYRSITVKSEGLGPHGEHKFMFKPEKEFVVAPVAGAEPVKKPTTTVPGMGT